VKLDRLALMTLVTMALLALGVGLSGCTGHTKPNLTSANSGTTRTTSVGYGDFRLVVTERPITVSPGSSVTLRINTLQGAECLLYVGAHSAWLTVDGLGSKKADVSGNVSWTWKVDPESEAGNELLSVEARYQGKVAAEDMLMVVSR
jgi:hypothetical protein